MTCELPLASYAVLQMDHVLDTQLDLTDSGALPAHAHRRAIMVLVLRGAVREWREARVAAPLRHAPGDVFFLSADIPHSTAPEAGLVRCFSVEFGARWSAWARQYCPDDPRTMLPESPHLELLATRLYQAFVYPARVSPLDIEQQLLRVLARRAAGEEQGGSVAPAWLRRARDYLHDRFLERISMVDLAAELHVHPVHLSRAFRRHFGITMTDFVRARRLEHARRALATSDLTISAIALAAGFADHAHLSRTWREMTGMTPAAYRALFR